MKKRLLWVGDAACPSGFALSTHKILETLKEHYEVSVLGLNYTGDPHSHPYPIYTCYPGGDLFGVGRIANIAQVVNADVIVLQNDPWNIPHYLEALQSEGITTSVAAVVAVDGQNCIIHPSLNTLKLAVFWTRFGENEARLGGYTEPSAVIPLGVDSEVYFPTDRQYARRACDIPEPQASGFIVGNVNRNQPRKRMDLCVRYFASWVHRYGIEDAYLFLHVAPTGDMGANIRQLVQYYDLQGRVLLREPPAFVGVSEEVLRNTYCMFDVQVNPGQGEGFGLTTLEGMACGIPQIVTDWAALGEWAKDTAVLIPSVAAGVGPFVGVIGGVPGEELFVQALHAVYSLKEYRTKLRTASLNKAAEQQFRWDVIGNQFRLALEGVGL